MTTASAPIDRQAIEQMVRQALQARVGAGGDLGSGGGGGGGGLGGALPVQITEQLKTNGVRSSTQPNPQPNPLVVNVSARHVHVSQEALEVLFGPGAQLTKLKDLYQDGEFASKQTVNLIGPRNRMIPNIRILGPVRSYTQVELSYTDGIYMGLDLPLKTSGDLDGTPGCVLVGPHGALNLEKGLIRALRHVHMHPEDCKHFGVQDGDMMKLKIDGPCGLVLEQVLVREHPKVKLEVHIDTDEGNACHLSSATHIELMK